MKKQIIVSLSFAVMVLGINSFAHAADDRSYAELTLMQQNAYNKLSEEQKQNTTDVFRYKVYGAKKETTNKEGKSYFATTDDSAKYISINK